MRRKAIEIIRQTIGYCYGVEDNKVAPIPTIYNISNVVDSGNCNERNIYSPPQKQIPMELFRHVESLSKEVIIQGENRQNNQPKSQETGEQNYHKIKDVPKKKWLKKTPSISIIGRVRSPPRTIKGTELVDRFERPEQHFEMLKQTWNQAKN